MISMILKHSLKASFQHNVAYQINKRSLHTSISKLKGNIPREITLSYEEALSQTALHYST
jgi:hypothetical protein